MVFSHTEALLQLVFTDFTRRENFSHGPKFLVREINTFNKDRVARAFHASARLRLRPAAAGAGWKRAQALRGAAE